MGEDAHVTGTYSTARVRTLLGRPRRYRVGRGIAFGSFQEALERVPSNNYRLVDQMLLMLLAP